MLKAAVKENYGTPLLNKMIKEASSLGIRMSFWRDMENKYVIIFNSTEYVLPKSNSAASACWFARGLVEMAKSQLIRR